MQKYLAAFKAAFPLTLPICAAYLFLGMSFGIYFCSKGFSAWYPSLTAMTVFAGSLEFVIVTMLMASFDPIYMFLLAVMINARHLFYGISMLEPYKNMGLAKLYLIFGLTDETFAINVAIAPPPEVDKKTYYLLVTFLNQCYWVTGATLGGLIGSSIHFNTKGLDFVLTALFVAIFVSQYQSMDYHLPAFVGLIIPTLCLIALGAKHFIPPAMVLIIVFFVYMYRKESKALAKSKGGEQA